ncbi:peptidase S8/S53 domain-containing protein [Xylariomycetidae sp. FL0641]|nr:peptidase S8/S53 domain-containing protein [Xylariomycetidae sp. FL0641]
MRVWCLFGALACALGTHAAEEPADSVPGAYIVEFSGGQTADALYRSLQSDYSIEVQHRRSFDNDLFTGASFQLVDATKDDRARLVDAVMAQTGVKQVWPVRTVPIDRPASPAKNASAAASSGSSEADARKFKRGENNTDTFSTHLMTQVDKLRAEGVTGKGFRISIIDSGVDYNHPALGGCFGPGCLVEAGYDFTGDDYNPPHNSPVPDDDPHDDCEGHGTHVSGIIAAQLEGNKYGFTGAAPGVKLAMYRAWGCPGTSTTDIQIAAFMMAYEDGTDIISCSNGKFSGWAEDAWGVVASRIAEKGVVVVISAGNDGGQGLFSESSPATGRHVIACGAVENSVLPILLSGGSYDVPGTDTANESFAFMPGTPAASKDLDLPLWAVGYDTESIDDACSPLPDDTPDLSDKLVLLRVPDNREGCYQLDQATNIAAKGGKNLVYYAQTNLTIEEQFIYHDDIEGVYTVAPYVGAQWIDLLRDGQNVTVSIPSNASTVLEELENPSTGGFTTYFSSWGPTWDLFVKPQVTAPGGDILSTYPVAMGSYAILSGTSMVAPIVAGIVALLGEMRGKESAEIVSSLLSSTAKPLSWFDGTQAYDMLAPVPQQGGGMVQAWDAAHAKVLLSTSSISFNDTEHFAEGVTFGLQNTGSEAVTYELHHVKAETVYFFSPDIGTLQPAAFPNPTAQAWADLAFSSDSIRVPAGGSANVTVTATPPEGLNATLLPVYSGYVVLNSSSGDDASLQLPYMGVAARVRDIPMLQSSKTYLADNYAPASANSSYTIPTPDPADAAPGSATGNNGASGPVAGFPNLLLQTTLGTREVRCAVVSADGAELGPMAGFPQAYVTRTQSWTAYKGLLANGTVLPEGAYSLRVSALRLFGDIDEEKDWDVLDTVAFSVKYQATNATTAA